MEEMDVGAAMESIQYLNVELLNEEEDGGLLEEVALNSGQVYLHNGQYVVPVGAQAILLQDASDLQYVLGETEELQDEQIVCYTTDNLSLEEEPVTPLQVKTEPMYELAVQNDPESLALEPQDEEGSAADEQPRYQYAILKDGQLHLQTNLNVELTEEASQELQEQLSALQESIKLDEEQDAEAVGLNKITGRNLITGQTVTLDSYFNKLQQKLAAYDPTEEYNMQAMRKQPRPVELNKKMVVGKTASGKKIFGKILRVQMKGSDADEAETETPTEEGAATTVGELTEENDVQQRVLIRKHLVRRQDFNENIGKTLIGLMGLETVQKKITGKSLIVKYVERVYTSPASDFQKTVSYVYGRMELRDVGWVFVVINDDEPADELDDEASDISMVVEEEARNDETTSLTIITTVKPNGKKHTKVNLNPQHEHNCCTFCSKQFKTVGQVQSHVKNVHFDAQPKKPRSFECITCKRTFSTAGSLRRHETTHDLSMRPLRCAVCEQRFTDESSLRKHLMIHTGIRPFACEVCGRAFVTTGDLNFHRRIHNPIKQFSCDVCKREFSRHSNLVRHAEIHKGEGALHKCDVCGCSYSYASSLTRHIVQKHLGQR